MDCKNSSSLKRGKITVLLPQRDENVKIFIPNAWNHGKLPKMIGSEFGGNSLLRCQALH